MFTVYKTINNINLKYYIGIHQCKKDCRHIKNNICYYFGSGTAIKSAIKKYSKSNFKKEILFSFNNLNDAKQKEKELVNFLDINSYNMIPGGNLPPTKNGFRHSDETKEKIKKSVQSRKNKLSENGKKVMLARMMNGGWTKEEIEKRIETRKKNGSYDTHMSACHTPEAIAKRTKTRKLKNSYSTNLDHLKKPEIIFNRTKTRIKSQWANGKYFSTEILSKYGII